jgi:hypothetical protein
MPEAPGSSNRLAWRDTHTIPLPLVNRKIDFNCSLWFWAHGLKQILKPCPVFGFDKSEKALADQVGLISTNKVTCSAIDPQDSAVTTDDCKSSRCIGKGCREALLIDARILMRAGDQFLLSGGLLLKSTQGEVQKPKYKKRDAGSSSNCLWPELACRHYKQTH